MTNNPLDDFFETSDKQEGELTTQVVNSRKSVKKMRNSIKITKGKARLNKSEKTISPTTKRTKRKKQK